MAPPPESAMLSVNPDILPLPLSVPVILPAEFVNFLIFHLFTSFLHYISLTILILRSRSDIAPSSNLKLISHWIFCQCY
jgi:hypothetical protein